MAAAFGVGTAVGSFAGSALASLWMNATQRKELQEALDKAKANAADSEEKLKAEKKASKQKVADALKEERERAAAEKLEAWKALNRDYPIPDYLRDFVTAPQTVGKGLRFVNVGILGNSGAGKSSLLKAMIKRFGSDSKDLPAASFQGDGTKDPKPYLVKELGDKTRIWDLPGQGTELFPAETYLRDMGLKYFDAVLVVTADRVLENDLRLLTAVKHSGIWVSVARAKIDQAVEAGEHDGGGLSQEEVLQQVRKKLKEQLEDSTKIYLVTSRSHHWPKFGTIEPLCEDVAQRVKSQQALED